MSNFDWGWMETSEKGIKLKETLTKEIFVNNIYERIFKVEEGDVVVDIGASVGPFTYKILDKNPSRVMY